MSALYIDTGGATTNSGSRDANSPALSGTSNAVVTDSTVQLTVGTDLSSVDATAGSATQDTIFIADATNTNQKIFWITGKDDGLDQVTVSVAPTGVTASNWAIGGRMVLTPANYEAAVRAGDQVIFNNSPAASATDVITTRVAGDKTGGFIKWMGKAGSRPVITCSSTPQCIEIGAFAFPWIENLELVQQGASGAVINLSDTAPGTLLYSLKITDGGGNGITWGGGTGQRLIGSEITGVGGAGISSSAANNVPILVRGCNLHDLVGDGIVNILSSVGMVLDTTIIDTCAGRGILLSGANTSTGNVTWFNGLTVYGCGNSGLEVTDADCFVTLTNSIFSENGNAAGEFNVEFVAAAAELLSFHAWNVFYHSGGGGGANLSNLTVNAQVASSEFTTDPQFTNAAGADFSIATTSPAYETGFPGQFLG